MISYRHADLINSIDDAKNKLVRQQAMRYLNEAARKHHIYEHNFEDIQVDEITYAGIIQVIYDARYIAGSPMTMDDPGEQGYYEVEILNLVILPGDIVDENGVKIYDMETTKRLCSDIGEMLDDNMLQEDINEYECSKAESMEPPDRDGDDR